MKNRIRTNLLIMAALFLMLASCSLSPTATEQRATPPDTNPFESMTNDTEQSQSDEGTSLGGYGLGAMGFDPMEKVTLTYDGSPITLSYYFEGTGSETEVGLMFFLDGMAQPYQILETSRQEETSAIHEEVYLSKFQLSSNIRIEFTVAMTPVTGSVGDELGLFPVVLFEPSFFPETEEGNFGIFHNANFYFPVSIQIETNAPQQAEDFVVDVETAPIPESRKDQSDLNPSGRVDQPVFTLYTGEFLSWGEPRLTAENGKITLKLSGYGGVEAAYRVTIFVNHTPVPIAGHDNFLIETHYDQVSTFSFTLDIQGDDQLNSLYAIAVPVGESYKNDDIYGQKTSSVLLINDLTEPLTQGDE